MEDDNTEMYKKMLVKIEDQNLVKYDLPFTVQKTEKPKLKTVIEYGSEKSPLEVESVNPTIVETACALREPENEELLNYLLPPKEWVDSEHRIWRRQVSSSPGTRYDVIHLKEHFDQRLSQMNANTIGICPIRRELYRQCFDEIIRQATVICGERGLLLFRIRNEAEATLKAYESVYKSALAYGFMKILGDSTKVEALEEQLKKLVEYEEQLNESIKAVETHLQERQKVLKDESDDTGRTHQQEMDLLQRTNDQLKQKLLRFMAPDARQGGFF